MPRKPNFFIVGIPKSGTTSLAAYLEEHPNIFMSTPKELNYFTETVPEAYRSASTEEEYLSFFEGCSEENTAIGEASVRYCLSATSIERLWRFNDKSRIILVVRNPVDTAVSLHRMLYAGGDEDVPDFETAWNRQSRRLSGLEMPRGTWESQLLQYLEVAKPAQKINRIRAYFPKTQVKVVLFDDLVQDPGSVYRDLLSFLDVPAFHKAEFQRYKQATKNRNQWLARLINRPPRVIHATAHAVRKRTGLKDLGLSAIRNWLNALNKDGNPVFVELSAHFRADVARAFRKEVEELSGMVDRDLTHWV